MGDHTRRLPLEGPGEEEPGDGDPPDPPRPLASLTDVTPPELPAKMQAQPNDYAKRWALSFVQMADGHVLIPYGDYGPDTGPIDVIGWRPSDGHFETYLADVPDERIEQYRILNDDQVWSCNTDPRAREEAHLATGGLDGTGWRLVEVSVPGKGVAVHMFDVAQTSNGDLFVCGTRNYTTAEALARPLANPDPEQNTALFVWRSTNGGENWTEDFVDLKDNDGFYRPLGFGKIGDHLFISPVDSSGHWRRDGVTGDWSAKQPMSLHISYTPPVWGDAAFAVFGAAFTESDGVLTCVSAEAYRYLWHGPEGWLRITSDATLAYGSTELGRLAEPQKWSQGVVTHDGDVLLYDAVANRIARATAA